MHIRLISFLCIIMLFCSCTKEGPMGPAGATGDTGAIGLQGEQGVKGDQGSQGDIGPPGPSGQPGQPGEEGAVILYITGAVSEYDYEDPFWTFYHYLIAESSIIQVYVTSNKDIYAWRQLPDPLWNWDLQITEGKIYITDANKDLVGWDFMIKIIENK